MSLIIHWFTLYRNVLTTFLLHTSVMLDVITASSLSVTELFSYSLPYHSQLVCVFLWSLTIYPDHSLVLYECIAWLACMPTIPYFSSLNLQCVNLLFHRVIILSQQLAHFTVCSEKHASHLECLWLDFHDWSMRIYCLLFITSQSLKTFLTTLIQCKSFLTFSAFNRFLW